MKSSLNILCITMIAITSPVYAAYYGSEPLPEVEALDMDSPPSRGSHAQRQANPMIEWFKRVDDIQKEVQELRGRVEVQDYELKQLKSNYEAEIAALKRQLGQEDSAKHSKEKPTFTLKRSPKASDAFDFDPAQGPPPEKELYQGAYLKLQNKDYLQAEKGFLMLLKHYPRGQYAPNALYWLAEVHMLNKEEEAGIESFQKIVSDFPAHPKAGDALFKLGVLAYENKNWGAARLYFKRVKSQFPNAASARLADNRLGQMASKGV